KQQGKRPGRSSRQAVPPRPGPAPALGLRAGRVVHLIVPQTNSRKENPSMPFTRWLRNLRSLCHPHRTPGDGRRADRKARARFRPRLEVLEDRLAPAVLTVTTTHDEVTPKDGNVSLREAIAAINNGSGGGDTDIANQNPGTFGSFDTIRFAPGLNGPIT